MAKGLKLLDSVKQASGVISQEKGISGEQSWNMKLIYQNFGEDHNGMTTRK